jgi:hypothetical protein
MEGNVRWEEWYTGAARLCHRSGRAKSFLVRREIERGIYLREGSGNQIRATVARWSGAALRRAEEVEITDPDETPGQDMLEEAVDELVSGEGTKLVPVGIGISTALLWNGPEFVRIGLPEWNPVTFIRW